MNASRLSPLLLIAAGLLTCAPTARAQDDMIPRELVEALLPWFGIESDPRPELLVGRAPESFPAEALPAGARVLGATVGLRYTVVVAQAGDAPAAVQSSVASRLQAAGWRPEAPDGPFGRGGGFVSAQAPRETPLFCGPDNRYVSLTVAAREGGGSDVRVMYSADRRFSPCGRRREAGHSQLHSLVIPSLVAPPGCTTRGGSSSSTAEGSHAVFARITTEMRGGELLSHYAEQLRQAGWTLTQRAEAGGLATQVVQARDSEGNAWTGVLSTLALPGGKEYDASLRMVRDEEPERAAAE
ncbi:MAG TPA: hypothetical protein VFQ45_18365 [Longimicrobium sp.]|nr:hypothetical protein [Longimicrobium sp.]